MKTIIFAFVIFQENFTKKKFRKKLMSRSALLMPPKNKRPDLPIRTKTSTFD